MRPITTPTPTSTKPLATSRTDQVSASRQGLDRSLETSVATIRQELLQKLDRSLETSAATIRQEMRDGNKKFGSQIANTAQRMGSLQDVVDQLPAQMKLLFANKQVMDTMRGQIAGLQQDTDELRLELVGNAAQQQKAIEDMKTANDDALEQMRQDVTPEVWETIAKITSSSTQGIQSILDTQGKRFREFAERYSQNKSQVRAELQALESKVKEDSKAIESLSQTVRRSEALNKSLSQRLDEVNTAIAGCKQNWEHTRSGILPQAQLVDRSSSQSRASSYHLPAFLQRDESSGSARNEGDNQEKVKRQVCGVPRPSGPP